MISWVAGALLGPLFRWFAYRAEVHLWMDELMDELDEDQPIPFELVS